MLLKDQGKPGAETLLELRPGGHEGLRLGAAWGRGGAGRVCWAVPGDWVVGTQFGGRPGVSSQKPSQVVRAGFCTKK